MAAERQAASLTGAAINFDRLEQSLQRSVEKEERYWRENDAKFRAMAQKVATYEEFEDIVKASHIKPLTEDITQLDLKRSSWTTSGRQQERHRRKLVGADPASSPDLDNTTVPATPQDFVRRWRSRNGPQRYSLAILAQVLTALHENYQSTDREAVSLLLRACGKAPRFALATEFFTPDDCDVAKQLWQCVAQDADAAEVDKLRRGWSHIIDADVIMAAKAEDSKQASSNADTTEEVDPNT
ncbi:uncharacterized protein MONBRDRAFT_21844 [Monosiga brevicollis MX1]|uniref:Dynein attachment factor N-terminal domain-containing protein n=1 Tax=Monosiga brevicollis TaxID=81824 RepID=A9UNS4_MONBE|nr:uncharacterized protein MONBRDRAFT_21844 [Monosiga brevicollis MX1]EDQ92295.1 predicted protein [Monosiga brevicollis MX1]|eukprot:XP_001742057.1 hypothetical protein [Monosiga brevicollis MX1]